MPHTKKNRILCRYTPLKCQRKRCTIVKKNGFVTHRAQLLGDEGDLRIGVAYLVPLVQNNITPRHTQQSCPLQPQLLIRGHQDPSGAVGYVRN